LQRKTVEISLTHCDLPAPWLGLSNADDAAERVVAAAVKFVDREGIAGFASIEGWV